MKISLIKTGFCLMAGMIFMASNAYPESIENMVNSAAIRQVGRAPASAAVSKTVSSAKGTGSKEEKAFDKSTSVASTGQAPAASEKKSASREAVRTFAPSLNKNISKGAINVASAAHEVKNKNPEMGHQHTAAPKHGAALPPSVPKKKPLLPSHR